MRIVLIGSGNVATHLGKALYEAGHEIVQVFSRTKENAINLSAVIESAGIVELNRIDLNADIYILSIKDDILSEVIESFPLVEGLVCHTAGSVSMDILQKFKKRGVFYPFQTFSKEKEVDFKTIPILIEAGDENSLKQLRRLASSISNQISEVSSYQRQQLHVSAVFACNFVNHMYLLASDLLKQSNLSFELIKPLIKETAEKVMTLPPDQTQTGPASRNDTKIIDKHMGILKAKEPFESVYKLLTNSILEYMK